MNDVAPRFDTSEFHNDASNVASQAQQIVIYGGQQNHL
jgi:restriction endonuclease Mrr